MYVPQIGHVIVTISFSRMINHPYLGLAMVNLLHVPTL